MGFALWRDFADQHITRLDIGADADDARFIEILEEGFADVRDVTCDFFRTELRVSRFDFEFLNVNRSVVVILDQALGNENRIFKVIPAPRHERDEHVPAQGEFTLLRARPICENLALSDPITLPDDRLLVDTGVLVGSLELGERIDVGSNFTREVAIFGRFHANNDALGIKRVHDSIAATDHHGAGIASRDLFHAGSHQWGRRAKQRHGLALHIRSHERPVRVVVFKERDERCRNRNQLLWRYVDVIDFVTML